MSDALDHAALERLIDAYCDAWNQPDGVERERILREVWAEDATYTDPRTHTNGVAELNAYIEQIRSGRPGAQVVRTSVIDTHHDLVRFAWRIVQADGTLLPEGIDFAEVSRAGKIQRIVGFFGSLAPSNRL